jgi:hypothetical protein
VRSIKSIRCTLDEDDVLFCLLYPAGMEAVRMAMWVVCAILTYEGEQCGSPSLLVGGLGNCVCDAFWQCKGGFVLSFDMECIKGGCFVLFCLGGAIRNQRMISYARLA